MTPRGSPAGEPRGEGPSAEVHPIATYVVRAPIETKPFRWHPGVYVALDHECVEYVGASYSLGRRIAQHMTPASRLHGCWFSAFVLPVGRVPDIELRLIAGLEPRLNAAKARMQERGLWVVCPGCGRAQNPRGLRPGPRGEKFRRTRYRKCVKCLGGCCEEVCLCGACPDLLARLTEYGVVR